MEHSTASRIATRFAGLPADKRASKNHWGRIIDSHSGDAFLPDVKSLGW